MCCIQAVASLHKAPASNAMQLTQALRGEAVTVFDEADGFSFVQLHRDGYVGYLSTAALAGPGPAPQHSITVIASHIYPEASIKSQPALSLPLHARFHAVGKVGAFLELAEGGFVFAVHTENRNHADFVSVAEQFLHVPYYWGGKSHVGIDCSGLVQVSLQALGIHAPRDSDMQEAALGQPLGTDHWHALERGDLVFWKGHVGIMQSCEQLLHANGHHMQVVSEPFAVARQRIAAAGSAITSIKRL